MSTTTNLGALRQQGGGAATQSPIASFAAYMERLKPQMGLALPKHMNADRMTRLAMTAFSTSKDLQNCSFQSIAASIMTACQLGLEIGVLGQAYLIPYKGTCTLVPGWKGLADLVSRSGRATVWTGAVRAGDDFDYQLGDAPFCRHRPDEDGDDTGKFTHVYAIGRVRDAAMPVIEVWSRKKVERHLDQYNKVGGKHYALKDENNLEMYGRKVALLQVLKYMPSSTELSNAIAVTHAAEEGKGVVIEGEFVNITEEPQADNAQAERDRAAFSRGAEENEDAEPGMDAGSDQPAQQQPAGAQQSTRSRRGSME